MSGIKDYSTTPANNTALFPEGMARAQVNDSSRQVQADIRSWYETAEWVDYGYTPTYVSGTSFSMVGDKTTFYSVGRRIRITDSSTLYGVIATSSFSAGNTTVTVTLDSGSISASITATAIHIIKLASQGLYLTGMTLAGTTALTNITVSGTATFADIKVVDSINDTNNNEVIIIGSTASAVNEITVTNAATGSGASIAATGSDSTIPLNLVSKGGAPINANGSPLFTIVPKQIIISNNGTDANNDIDFATGNFPFSDGTGIATLSAITKRLDAAWAAGTNQGGLDTSTKASSTWYHCYAIYNPTTQVADAIFSTNATSPTLPSGYTKFKRVGSILTDSASNLRAFNQTNNYFNFVYPISSVTSATQLAATETLRTIATPLGLKTKAMFSFVAGTSSAGSAYLKAYSADITSSTIPNTDGQIYVSNGVAAGAGYVEAITNTASQIKTNAVNLSGTPNMAIAITVNGWQDITL